MTECDHVECLRDEPDDLHDYRLTGTIQPVIRSFCLHHDPRQDPRNGELWEAV